METAPVGDDARESRRLWAAVARWVILIVVVLGVGRRIWLEKEKLAAYDLRLAPAWLVVSGVCYLAGLSTCAVFWWSAMRDCGGRPTWASTLLAYFAGHLGKYVPGKGLVLVIRASAVRGPEVTAAAAAVTSAHETVLMMAAGAAAAAALLGATDVAHRAYLQMLSVGLAVGLGVLALPPVVSRLGRLATRPFRAVADSHRLAARWSTVAVGAAVIAVGWLLMGLSLTALLAAMHVLPSPDNRLALPRACVLATAVVAIATVGGFVSLTPGGLGSREWILVETLGPIVGIDHAVVAAVLLRIVWIVSEVIATGWCWVLDRAWSRTEVHPS